MSQEKVRGLALGIKDTAKLLFTRWFLRSNLIRVQLFFSIGSSVDKKFKVL